jgi:predicted NAD/FAD-binding protein
LIVIIVVVKRGGKKKTSQQQQKKSDMCKPTTTANNGTTTANGGTATATSNVTTTAPPQRKVAVIGGGVTGLSAAWHLSENANNNSDNNNNNKCVVDVTLFESEDRLGGHAYTVPVPLKKNKNKNDNNNKKSVDVDIGFMVYNETNYPNMTKWFEALSSASNSNSKEEEGGEAGEKEADNNVVVVVSENSDMSLSVSLDNGKTLEWSSNGSGLNGIFAKRSQILDIKFYNMINDMNKFHINAPKFLLLHKNDPRRLITTKQYLKQNNYSNEFSIYYLLPMMAALWSSSMNNVLDFPAIQLISFLCNHQMLQLFNRPQVCKIC